MTKPENPQQFNKNTSETGEEKIVRLTTGEEKIVRLTTLYTVIRRHGLHIASFRRIVRRRPQGRYWRDEVAIRITPKLEVEYPLDDVQPTAFEKAAIVDEIKTVDWPTWEPAAEGCELPEELKDVAPEKLLPFPTQHLLPKLINTRGIEMIEHRFIGRSGKKVCVLWTYWSDKKWRPMEPERPDELLPLYGLHLLNDAVMVYLHEGAKSARAGQEIAEEATEKARKHPWKDALKYTTHLGWPGGALHPERVDWGPLRKFAGTLRIIADNDEAGIKAVPKISRMLKRSMVAVRFTDLFPRAFDLADEWPQHKEWKAKKTGHYIGPTLRDLASPATWATNTISTGNKGRPAHVLRADFASEWVYAVEPDRYINRLQPERSYSEKEFNALLKPFSDVQKTSSLLQDEFSSQVDGIIYRPGHDLGIVSDEGKRKINIYAPSTIKPKNGDPAPFIELMTYLIPDFDDRREFMRWFATLVAQPESRVGYGVLLISEVQGVGKTTLGEVILTPLVGRHNVSFPSEKEITGSDFNGWMPHKRLAIVNEIYAGQNNKAYDQLKSVMTDKNVRVNEKHEKAYDIENWIQILAFSNDAERALQIHAYDRRWFIPRVVEVLRSRDEWRRLRDWLDADGLSIIRQWADYFLLFNEPVQPGDHAPMTARKREMIAAGRTPGVKLVNELAAAMLKSGREIIIEDRAIVEWVHKERMGDARIERKETLIAEAKRVGLIEGPKRYRVRSKEFAPSRVFATFEITPDQTWPNLAERHRTPAEVLSELDLCEM